MVEGLTTAPVLRDLSHRLGLEMPITEGVCAVLEGVSLADLVAQLMRREPTTESGRPALTGRSAAGLAARVRLAAP